MRVILNPVAGRGRGTSLKSELEAELRKRSLEFTLVQTSLTQTAEQLAKRALEEGERVIVAAGGDGTIGEISNALAGCDAVLGIVAIGTGNDLARSLGLPRNRVREAVAVLETGTIRSIDLGGDSGRCFTSVLGIGFPAEVADRANRYRWIRGTPAFSLAVYTKIRAMKPEPMEVEIDGREIRLNCTSALVLNTPFTGGGLRLAPSAQLDDGLLDAVLVDDIGRLSLLLNFPRVYRGTHLANPHFHSFKCRSFRLRSSHFHLKTLDGDIFGSQSIDVRVMPSALRVLVPRGVS